MTVRTEPLPRQVYAILADRAFHSGSALASQCGVSRSAIWKGVSVLRELGVSVNAVANRGYCLPQATELLAAERITAQLPEAVRTCLQRGSCVWVTGSTNADLLQAPPPAPGQFEFLTSEYQQSGRGRRARSWLAPPGGALCLSVSWSYQTLPPGIAALGLAIGVCARRALIGCGMGVPSLKWPNDLVVNGAKLGGILIELRAEAGGPGLVVIGIGCNVALDERVQEQVAATGTRATDLKSLGVEHCDRNRLAATLIAEMVAGLQEFGRSGLTSFAAEWRDADALFGKPVVITGESGPISGHARGIDSDGALCVQTREGVQRFLSGDVSVRESA